ncbi:MAG: hypothetical protein KDA35_02595, partial [Hyphomonadaceae bacterium]|nr:hypothetical protein [Hyphomonadaceae bacterium]
AGGVGPQTPLPQHIQMDLEQRAEALRAEGVVAVGIGETADLGNGLRVRPLEVLEDSRCPQNARCVWAGRLRLRVNIEGVGAREIEDNSDAVQTPRGAFSLVAVSPGSWTDWPEGAKPPYRFGFHRA